MFRNDQNGFSLLALLMVIIFVVISLSAWGVWHNMHQKIANESKNATNERWLTYTDAKNGFSYQYPPNEFKPWSSDWLEQEDGGGSVSSPEYVPKGTLVYPVHTTEAGQKDSVEGCFGCFFRVDVIKASIQEVVHHEEVDSNGNPIKDIVEQDVNLFQSHGMKIFSKSKPNDATYLLEANNFIYRLRLIAGDAYWEKSFSSFQILPTSK